MASLLSHQLPDSILHLVPEIDRALATAIGPREGCPPRLQAAMAHSLLAPGKRLRPLLVLLAAQACGSPPDGAMPAACAVEMVHTYSLIHDDLPAMDDDDLRRGQPSCHVAFDEATAILAGDALLTRAFEVLATELRPAEVALACCATLSAAAGMSNMVGGQADDLDGSRGAVSLPRLESIHRRKTGAMLVAALRMGGIIAEADDDQLRRLTKTGESLGLAFQIIDDLLDCEGDESSLGKRTMKDSRRNKLTFPGVMGMAASRARADDLTQAAISALAPFGDAGKPLVALAAYLLDRNR